METPSTSDIQLPWPKPGPQESFRFPEDQITSSPSYRALSEFLAEKHVDAAMVMKRSFEQHLSFHLADERG